MITQNTLERALLKRGKAKKNRLKWRDGSTLEITKRTPQKIEVNHDGWDGQIRPTIVYYFDTSGNLKWSTFRIKWQALFIYAIIPIGVGMIGTWLDTRSVEKLQVFWWLAPGAIVFALFLQFLASLRTRSIIRKLMARKA